MKLLSSSPRLVTTITPHRISFAGGGTDFEEFYRKSGGAVVSTTIDQYVYVTVTKRSVGLFDEQYRLNYFESEHVNSIDEIRNETARECLRLVPVDPPLYISTSSDVPASSGLGSSSSFAVGLLLALHTLRGEMVSSGQLAEEACYVEIEAVGRPIGKQDQFAAAFGGLNSISFGVDGRIAVEPLWMSGTQLTEIFESSLLFWTGLQRPSQSVLSEQRSRIVANSSHLQELASQARRCKEVILSSTSVLDGLGVILQQGWNEKKQLASNVTSDEIDAMYDSAMRHGGLGAKLCGAGAGGFLWLMAPTNRHEELIMRLAPHAPLRVKYEPRGSRVLALI